MNNIMIGSELAEKLIGISCGNFEFGTPIDDGGKDIDCVFLLPNMDWWLAAPVDTHHWLHYKGHDISGNSVDYLFTTVADFHRALIDGSSHVPIEVMRLNEGKLNGTVLEYTGKYDEYFNTYRVLRSYLGLARKDIKQCREFSIKGSVHKSLKKKRFIIDGLNRVSKAMGLESWIKEDATMKNVLEDAQPFHDHLRLELNKMKESGDIETFYPYYLAESGVYSQIHAPKMLAPVDRFQVLSHFMKNEGG